MHSPTPSLLPLFCVLLFPTASGQESAADGGVLLLRAPGSPRLNVRLQVPNEGDIEFHAPVPECNSLTEDPVDNRLFLDLAGCRLSLDWSLSLFGTTSYFRNGTRPRPKRKWRVGPVRRLKMGSAIKHYDNAMLVQISDSRVKVSSVGVHGQPMGAQQVKVVQCPLQLAGGVLDLDLFSPPGAARCTIGMQFGPSYRLLSSAQIPGPEPEPDFVEAQAIRD